MSSLQRPTMHILWITRTWPHHSAHSGYIPLVEAMKRDGRARISHLDLYAVAEVASFKVFARQCKSALRRLALRRLWQLTARLLALRALQRDAPEVIHFASFEESRHLVATFRRRFRRARIAGSWHQPHVAASAPDERVDLRVFLAESQRQAAAPDHGVGVVVPHGVDTDFFAPRAAPRRDDVVFLGHWLRDFATLADCIDAVLARHAGVRFKLIIPAAEPIAYLRARLPAAGDRVEYLRDLPTDELKELLRRSRLMVMPLIAAVANNALLEGMASGLPIVATDVGGVREYAQDGAAILVAPGDGAGMAAAVLDLLDDDERCQRMGQAARRVAETFAWSRVASQMLDAYSAKV